MKTDLELSLELKSKMHGDEEGDHIAADDFVIAVLKGAGYPELAKTYSTLCDHFWYA